MGRRFYEMDQGVLRSSAVPEGGGHQRGQLPTAVTLLLRSSAVPEGDGHFKIPGGDPGYVLRSSAVPEGDGHLGARLDSVKRDVAILRRPGGRRPLPLTAATVPADTSLRSSAVPEGGGHSRGRWPG